MSQTKLTEYFADDIALCRMAGISLAGYTPLDCYHIAARIANDGLITSRMRELMQSGTYERKTITVRDFSFECAANLTMQALKSLSAKERAEIGERAAFRKGKDQ